MMTRAISSILALALSLTAAHAVEYEHNGSLVDVTVTEDRVRITYLRPRDGLRRIGVRKGTLLFEGKVEPLDDGGPYVEGMARLFKAGCQPAPYYVHGAFRLGKAFQLNGAAPVFAKTGCRNVDNTYEGSNANMKFERVASRDPGQKRVTQNKKRPGSLCVANISAGGTLNVRSGPGANYGRVGTLEAQDCNVAGLRQCINGWCAVMQLSDGTIGWVSQDYIRSAQ
ncbi:SH3 domain-containing protein [Pseudahrensia aquimaris]|uniref:SH3 domain-containing protein n=1 Tax=Pseudahrensia aquimaris TaxID=744461 RepID=A0ABW3F961_9HYPH